MSFRETAANLREGNPGSQGVGFLSMRERQKTELRAEDVRGTLVRGSRLYRPLRLRHRRDEAPEVVCSRSGSASFRLTSSFVFVLELAANRSQFFQHLLGHCELTLGYFERIAKFLIVAF